MALHPPDCGRLSCRPQPPPPPLLSRWARVATGQSESFSGNFSFSSVRRSPLSSDLQQRGCELVSPENMPCAAGRDSSGRMKVTHQRERPRDKRQGETGVLTSRSPPVNHEPAPSHPFAAWLWDSVAAYVPSMTITPVPRPASKCHLVEALPVCSFCTNCFCYASGC